MCKFLYNCPLLYFTSKNASSLLGLFASSTLIPLICAVKVKYSLTKVTQKVILL